MFRFIPLQKQYILYLVLFMTLLSGFSINLYAPSFPAMQNYFHTSQYMVKLIIPVYLFSYSIGVLLLGTVSDYLGRRKVLIICMFLFVFDMLIQAYAPTIMFLLIAHLFQGVLIAAPDVLGKAIIADSHSEHEIPKAFASLSISWTLCPIVAPALGGYFQYFFGWRGNFIFLAIFGFVILVLAAFTLPETCTNKSRLDFRIITKNYQTILSSKVFYGATICSILGFVLNIIFVFSAPFLIQDKLHYSPIQYGHMALIIGVALFFGVIINRLMLSVLSAADVIFVGCLMMVGASIVVWVFGLFNYLSIFTFLAPVVIVFFFRGFVTPNCSAKQFVELKSIAGALSSLSGSIVILVTSLVSSIFCFIKTDSFISFSEVYLVLTILILITYMGLIRPYFCVK